MAWCMGAIYDGEQAFLFCDGANFFYGQHKCRGGGDVADEDCFGFIGDTFKEVFYQLFFRNDRKRDVLPHIGGPAFFTIVVPGFVAGSIFEVGGKDLIAGRQLQAFGHDVDSIGGIEDVDQIVGVTMDVIGQCFPGLPEIAQPVDGDELDRFVFQFALPLLVVFENRFGSSAERAEIEVSDVGIEEELCF